MGGVKKRKLINYGKPYEIENTCLFCRKKRELETVVCKECFTDILEAKIDNESILESIRMMRIYIISKDTASIIKVAKQFYSASRKGCSRCLVILGLIFARGFLGYQDLHRAVNLWEKALKSGNLNAIHLIGMCYYRGIVKEKNENLAFDLWSSAAFKGHKLSEETLLGRCSIVLMSINENMI
jgi:TPR repeat protein